MRKRKLKQDVEEKIFKIFVDKGPMIVSNIAKEYYGIKKAKPGRGLSEYFRAHTTTSRRLKGLRDRKLISITKLPEGKKDEKVCRFTYNGLRYGSQKGFIKFREAEKVRSEHKIGVYSKGAKNYVQRLYTELRVEDVIDPKFKEDSSKFEDGKKYFLDDMTTIFEKHADKILEYLCTDEKLFVAMLEKHEGEEFFPFLFFLGLRYVVWAMNQKITNLQELEDITNILEEMGALRFAPLIRGGLNYVRSCDGEELNTLDMGGKKRMGNPYYREIMVRVAVKAMPRRLMEDACTLVGQWVFRRPETVRDARTAIRVGKFFWWVKEKADGVRKWITRS